ncbi:hypothetical protein [Streptomyces sp. bgisy153]|uniref:hypothetical protein n=1 Tax=Streptomyces sp. bgisy153 TaxID=3413793 RepID=UPI003D719450
MPTSSTDRPPTPSTVWLARGRHTGAAPAEEVVRQLRRRKNAGDVLDFLELSDAERPAGRRVFEARWTVPGDVTVRARLELADAVPGRGPGQAREWILVAEAEAPWSQTWPAPSGRFWPEPERAREPGDAEGGWDHAAVPGLRLGAANRLPADDKDLRRVLRAALRDDWSVHLVVHEAMTTDERGSASLVRFLPAGLRDRVVEHRAAPHQLRAVNWALRDSGAQVPRGGAVLLPGGPGSRPDDGDWSFAVRTVFLDGSEPSELIDAVTRYTAVPGPLPSGAEEVLTALREQWHVLTPEEELARQKQLVAMYAEALESMTRSRDLYREAAERAHEALAVLRENAADAPAGGLPESQPAARPTGSPFQQLTRTLERLKLPGKSARPPHSPTDPGAAPGVLPGQRGEEESSGPGR